MSAAPSSPLPGWWQRTWPVVLLGATSVAIWLGRVRNIVADESLSGARRSILLALAVSFVVLGAAVLVACWQGRRNRNWRESARRADDGWRVAAGIPEWGRRVAALLAGWTVVVWTVRGVDIAIDPGHELAFKVVHLVLMLGSFVVAGLGAWGLRRSWRVAPSPRAEMPS